MVYYPQRAHSYTLLQRGKCKVVRFWSARPLCHRRKTVGCFSFFLLSSKFFPCKFSYWRRQLNYLLIHTGTVCVTPTYRSTCFDNGCWYRERICWTAKKKEKQSRMRILGTVCVRLRYWSACFDFLFRCEKRGRVLCPRHLRSDTKKSECVLHLAPGFFSF